MTTYAIPTCPHCGAPVRELIDNACPFCRTPLVTLDAGGVPVAPPPPSGRVLLHACGRRKIDVIKVVREHTGLGLKESKELVESADRGPAVIAIGLDRADAERLVAELVRAGAQASIG